MNTNREFWGACLLMALGLFVSAYAWTHYRMGTIQNMGPGFVPFALALGLTGLGAIAALAAVLSKRPAQEARPFEWGKLLPVVMGVLAFAMSIDTLGLIPAIFLLVLISARADARLNLKVALTLSVALAFLSWLVFVVFLNMTIPVLG